MKLYLRTSASIFAALVMAPAAYAQEAAPVAAQATPAVAPETPAAAAAPVVAPATAVNVLPQGTEIHFVTLSDLTSQISKLGQKVALEVSEDVVFNGRVVIAKGSQAAGEVTLLRKKGMWGKSGKLEASVMSVRVNGVDVPVKGMVGDKGKVGTVAVVGVVLLSPLIVAPFAGFFVTGTSAVLPHGTVASAVLLSDLPFDAEAAPVAAAPAVAEASPAPAAAPATAPAPAAAPAATPAT